MATVKRERIPTRLRKQVWDSAEDPCSSIGKCVVCRSEIHILSFECAHIISVADGGKTVLENLLPCCSMCNRSMGKMNLYKYIELYHPQKLKSCPRPKKSVSFTDKIESSPCTKSVSSSKTRSAPKMDSGFFGFLTSIFTSSSTSSTSSKSINHCAHILEKGKNKGEYCSVKPISGSKYCSRHSVRNK